ncbi:MAG: 2-oxo acid dehydrogenase subunit E2 [Treponema sp.]|nr:2-oxo acid dehydrogenase subunit E2 [Treponema sp.]
MHVLIMPRQGNTVESCIITDWKVNEGESVSSETVVCEVETDKASFEIPAGASGKILKILHPAGDDVPVLEPIAVIGEEGENWKLGLDNREPKTASIEPGIKRENLTQTKNDTPGIQSLASAVPAPGSRPQVHNTSIPVLQTQPPAPNTQTISPRAKNLADKEAVPKEALQGSGPAGRIMERDVLAAIENRPALTAAAKAADGTIPQKGTGFVGKVTAEDIIKKPASPPPPLPVSSAPFTEVPVTGIRKIISDRMHKSLSETAQFTLNASASVLRLNELRERIKASYSLFSEPVLCKITVNDLILFAVSRVLTRYSYMNSHKTGDKIKTFSNVHLGMAVDTPRGLMVPVIRNANQLSLVQISAEAKRLSLSCQNGSAKPEEISGSTFSVSNLGSLGITGFTPVLNVPEVAILGVCGIELKPVAAENDNGDCGCCNAVFEPHIGFSLTIDHQAVDGAPAARFLKALCDAVKDIDLLLAAG